VHRRPILALVTACALLGSSPVRAQERALHVDADVEVDMPPIALARPDVLALTSRTLAPKAADLVATSPTSLSSPHVTDIRMSRGAKTAIIVTAIVVGVLVIAGVIVIGKPHKHL
jgi:hypothetical protein